MALIDFYQLAVLYNLSRKDADVLSNRSHPPPMSTTTPPSSRSSPVDSDQAGTSLPLPAQFGSKTPKHKRDATHPIPDPTPMGRGSSALWKQGLDADKPQKYGIDKYEQYIAQDFERHRVFIDIDVFMKNVLHVPDNWKTKWGKAIKKIKGSTPFSTAHRDYTRQCGTQGVKEEKFYKPLVDMGNAILGLSESSLGNSVKPRTPQRYLRNDPQKVLCGVMKDLTPDVVAVHSDLLPHICSKEREDMHLKESNLTWAQPLQVLEVKPWDNALVDGSCMPRLKVKGKLTTTSLNTFL